MIVDFHVHYQDVERLIDACDEAGIDKVGLIGQSNYHVLNDEVYRAMERYPDRIIGIGYVRLGVDGVEVVDELHKRGFKALKVIRPAARYDDPSFFLIYERAAYYRMPILFHLGIVARNEEDRFHDVNCDRMRPVYLDTIARRIPELTLIGAHLGNPWFEEACMAMRWNSNLYFDLSGSILKCKDAEWFRRMLWWKGEGGPYAGHGGFSPYEKIIFGTDVNAGMMGEVKRDYERLFAELGLDGETKGKIFGGTIRRLLRL